MMGWEEWGCCVWVILWVVIYDLSEEVLMNIRIMYRLRLECSIQTRKWKALVYEWVLDAQGIERKLVELPGKLYEVAWGRNKHASWVNIYRIAALESHLDLHQTLVEEEKNLFILVDEKPLRYRDHLFLQHYLSLSWVIGTSIILGFSLLGFQYPTQISHIIENLQ